MDSNNFPGQGKLSMCTELSLSSDFCSSGCCDSLSVVLSTHRPWLSKVAAAGAAAEELLLLLLLLLALLLLLLSG